MKVFVVLAALLLVANAADEFCYRDVVRGCKPTTNKQTSNSLSNCNAKYGAIDRAVDHLQKYVTTHISRSFEYLLMSTHFANYEKNREGFEKLFRDMSDSTWEDAINLIKYISKRGGSMNFNMRKKDVVNTEEGNGNYELYELESLAKAVDMQKQLAQDAFQIHEEVTRRHENTHDPEISSYIEEKFAHKHADKIRQLSGHVADLSKLLSGNDHSLAMYMFDDYLQKS